MISPFKAALGFDYQAFEARLEAAIHIRFGLPPKTPAAIKALIKKADRACAFFEATQLAGFLLRRVRGPLWPAAARLRPEDRALDALAGPGPLCGEVRGPDGQDAGGGRPRPRENAGGAHVMSADIVIGLSAVVLTVRDGDGVVLTVRPQDPATRAPSPLSGLPFGPFDPDGRRTFELALRAFVAEQTRFDLGYVEQLYTFGDKGRDAPLADVGAGAARVISVGYLALTNEAVDTAAPDTAWTPWARFFPWEDWRRGRPALIDAAVAPALAAWTEGDRTSRLSLRARLLFALDGAPWNEERVLERYELLYEAGLAPGSRARPRAGPEQRPGASEPGQLRGCLR